MREQMLPAARSDAAGWPWHDDTRARIPITTVNSIPWPQISIVTPSFNQGPFLEETIRSVLLQGYPNLEYIIIDGGSTDNSVEIIRKYEPWLTYWVSEKDRGQAHAIKRGFERAQGDVLGWLNSDDLILPGALAVVGRAFHKHPGSEVVYGNRLILNSDGTVVGQQFPPSPILRASWALGQPLGQESTFWRRDAYLAAGGMDESLFFAMDYDLFYRLFLRGRFRKVRRFLGCIREHEGTKSARSQDIRNEEFGRVKLRYGIKEPAPTTSWFVTQGCRWLSRRERLMVTVAWRGQAERQPSSAWNELE